MIWLVVVGVLSSPALVSTAPPVHQDTRSNGGHQNATAAQGEANNTQTTPVSDKTVNTEPKEQGTRAPDDKGNEDKLTRAERLSLVLDTIIAATAVVGLGVLIWQMAMLRTQMRDAEESTKKARDDTERSLGIAESQAKSLSALAIANETSANLAKLMERPWVTASISPRDILSINLNGRGAFLFSLVLENVGHSAATDIRYEVELFPVAEGSYAQCSDKIVARQASIYTRLAASLTTGFSLFPSEIGPVPVLREVDSEAVLECATPSATEWYVIVCIAGVLTYRFATSEAEHVTKFAFYVGEREPGKIRTVIQLGLTVLPDDLVFLKEFAASYAD